MGWASWMDGTAARPGSRRKPKYAPVGGSARSGASGGVSSAASAVNRVGAPIVRRREAERSRRARAREGHVRQTQAQRTAAADLLAVADRLNLPGRGVRPLSDAEKRGASLARGIAAAQGVPVSKVIAPYRKIARQTLGTRAVALEGSQAPIGAVGRGQAKAHAPGPLDLLRQAWDAQGGISHKSLGIRDRSTVLAPVGVSVVTPQDTHSVITNTAKDAVALGTMPYVGGVAAADALYTGAAHGDWRKAGTLAKGIGQGLLDSSAGQLLQGNPEGAIRALGEHPLIEATTYAGGAGVLGRGAGALVRGAGKEGAGGLRGGLARAGSTVRAPVAMVDDSGAAMTSLLKERVYSKDLIRKGIQVAYDRKAHPVLRDAEGKVVTTVQRGHTVPVRTMSKGAQRRAGKAAANADDSVINAANRTVREKSVVSWRETGKGGRKGRTLGLSRAQRSLLVLAVQRVVRTPEKLRGDLEKELGKIRSGLAKANTAKGRVYTDREIRLAESNAKTIEKLLASPHLDQMAGHVFTVAERMGRKLNKLEDEAGAVGIPVPARARLTTYAQAHMGARHVSVEEHAKLEKAARVDESAAKREWKDAAPADRPAAKAKWVAARERRIAVSGKHPEKLRRYEDAQAARARAGKDVKAAQQRVAKLREALAAKRAVTASHRGRGWNAHQVGNVEEAARAAAGVLRAGQKARSVLHELKVAEQELKTAKAVERHARKAAAKVKAPKAQAAFRYPDGRYLSNKEIRAQMVADGIDPDSVAFLPHRLKAEDAGSHYKPTELGSRTKLDKGRRRTGTMFEKGVESRDHKLIADEFSKKMTAIQRVKMTDRLIGEMGLRHPAWAKKQRGETLTRTEQKVYDEGGYFTPKEADAYARQWNEGKDVKDQLVAVTAHQAKLSKDLREQIRAGQDPKALSMDETTTIQQRMLAARKAPQGGTRNVVLLPKSYMDQLAKHAAPASAWTRFFQLLNGPFRLTVLTTNPKWLVGNFVEPYIIRLPLSGAGLNIPGAIVDVRAYRKTVKDLRASGDPKKITLADEMDARNGGLFIGNKNNTVQRTFESFDDGIVRNGLYVMHVVRNMPVTKQLADLILAIPQMVKLTNRVIEQMAQKQVIGKAMREDVQAFTGSWLQSVAMTKKMRAEVAKGQMNPATVRRYVKTMHDTLGKYEGFSPWVRHLISGPMPFLPWTMASLRWIYWTMPVHHTVTTALLLQAAQVVDADFQAAHKDAPPGSLRYAQRTKDGGYVDIARYTPFSLGIDTAEEGPLKGAADTFMPQFSGFLKAIDNKDPFGRPLKVSTGDGKATPTQRSMVAVWSLLEAGLPWVAQVRRLREGGGTGFADSTVFSPKVKPGSKTMGAFRRTYDPFRPTYLKAASESPTFHGEKVRAGGKTVTMPTDAEIEQMVRKAGG